MTDTVQPDNTPRETPPSRSETRFGVLAAPIAYGVVAVFNYFIAPAACQLLPGAGFTLLRLVTFLVTGAGLLVALWAAYRSYQNIVRARAAGASPDDSSRFLGVGGFMLSVLFVALTVIAGLSGLALRPCTPV